MEIRAHGRDSDDGRVAAAVSDMPELDAAGLTRRNSAPSTSCCIAAKPTRAPARGSWRVETPRHHARTGIGFRARFDNASRKVLRLRQKVVMPTLPTVAPRWVVDPDFNLDFHVRRVRVPEPGTLREVIDLAEVALQSPLDISRPLWTATLVEGLADGRAATMLHLSHAVTDGVGGVEMFANIYDLERDPPPQADAAAADSAGPVAQRPDAARVQPSCPAPSRAACAVRWSERPQAVGQVVRDPVSAVGGVVDYAHVGCPGDGPGRGTVAAAAAAQPVVAQRGHRHQVRRSAQGGQGRGRLDQRRLPGRAVRRAAALPRGQGHARSTRCRWRYRSTCAPTTIRPAATASPG